MASHPDAVRIPIHIGAKHPSYYRDLDRQLAEWDASGTDYSLDLMNRPAISTLDEHVDWAALGIEPRWLEEQTDDCAAAIDPGSAMGNGSDEHGRFLRGAALRGEPALILAIMRDSAGPRSVFGRNESVWLRGYTSVHGRRLRGVAPSIAPDLSPADADLAKRLRDTRRTAAPWWALSLAGAALSSYRGEPREEPPTGHLQPLLLSRLNEPVAAVWTPDDGSVRCYVLPDELDWTNLLRWLVEQALPAYTPSVLRELRSQLLEVDPALRSAREHAAHRQLAEVRSRFERELTDAQAALDGARAHAEQVRYPLLYGTGKDLERAVGIVLRDAGLTVLDLDEEFEGTVSADFLVEHAGRRSLVEVKSSSGTAGEALVGKLESHLKTWPNLRPQLSIDGGAMIVNHQHSRRPELRDLAVYQRREFVEQLTHPVISTPALLHWWLQEDWEAIRRALTLDEPLCRPSVAAEAAQPFTPPTSLTQAPARRWWRKPS